MGTLKNKVPELGSQKTKTRTWRIEQLPYRPVVKKLILSTSTHNLGSPGDRICDLRHNYN